VCVFVTSVPLLEIVFRTVVVYVAVFALLRIAGKRELGQMNVTDLVVILVIANAVQISSVCRSTVTPSACNRSINSRSCWSCGKMCRNG